MAIIARYTFREWYSDNIQETIAYLKSFARDNEALISKNITHFYHNKYTEIIEENDQIVDAFEIYKDFHHTSFDLEDIFTSYLPNLQRRSILATIFSYFEHSLNELCTLFDDTNNNYLNHIRAVGNSNFEESTNYLINVIGLSITKSNTIWKNLKDFQEIRNMIIHNDGRLKDLNGNDHRKAKKVRNIISQNQYLDGMNDIFILEGYLEFILNNINNYFIHIDRLLQAKYPQTS